MIENIKDANREIERQYIAAGCDHCRRNRTFSSLRQAPL
jgi:hypothetical protein